MSAGKKSVIAAIIYFICENKNQFSLLITGSQICTSYFDCNIYILANRGDISILYFNINFYKADRSGVSEVYKADVMRV